MLRRTSLKSLRPQPRSRGGHHTAGRMHPPAVGFFAVACFAGLFVGTSRLAAEPPWARLLPFQRVDADPQKEYRVTEENGPWMIVACSFSGEGAEEQAHELVLELRRDFRLPAYVHQRKYDFTGKVTGIGLDPKGRPRKMRYQNAAKFTEFAVLVGNYPSYKDSRIEKDLKTIKFAHPKTLDPKARRGKETAQSLAAIRQLYRTVNPEKKSYGPMYRAFVSRNPKIPREFFAQKGLDPLVLSMNRHVKYGLLDNPGTYTVQVATFKGEVHFETELKKEEKQGWLTSLVRRRKPSKLELAAERAHRLTMALREQGVEAYEFHDREMSIVTVGSFDRVGTQRPDGKVELDPAVYAVMKRYGASPTGPGRIRTGQAEVLGTGLVPKRLAGISFDVTPVPIRVPKKSIVQ